MSGERRPFTITKLRLDDDGIWRARVTVDGNGVDVDRMYGSWRVPADPKHGMPERQVHTYIALELAAKVRAIENARGPRKKEDTGSVQRPDAATVRPVSTPEPTPAPALVQPHVLLG